LRAVLSNSASVRPGHGADGAHTTLSVRASVGLLCGRGLA
jgi:hypothetical protein